MLYYNNKIKYNVSVVTQKKDQKIRSFDPIFDEMYVVRLISKF